MAPNFESTSNSENGPTMLILTERCTIKIFYRGKSNGENKRVTVKNVQSVVGMIKQSVLKQVKKGGGSW